MSKSAVDCAAARALGLPCTLPVGSQMQKEVMMHRGGGGGSTRYKLVMGGREKGTAGRPPSGPGGREGKRTRSSGNCPREEMWSANTCRQYLCGQACPQESLCVPWGTSRAFTSFLEAILLEQYEFIPKSLLSASCTNPLSATVQARVGERAFTRPFFLSFCVRSPNPDGITYRASIASLLGLG